MTQLEYSALAKDYISVYHPQFSKTISFKEDNSFDCSVQSNKKHLSLWIATYNSEITIGLDNSNGECDWHTHMSLFNADNFEDELRKMSGLIDSILSDQEPIIFSSKYGYSLTYDIKESFENKDADEILVVQRWSEV